jgi:hypothetical protein
MSLYLVTRSVLRAVVWTLIGCALPPYLVLANWLVNPA